MAKGLPENRDYIALALRHLRAELNLTQDELSLHSKITIQSISVLERGVGNPVLTNLEKLAKALQTTVPDLINLGKELKMANEPSIRDVLANNILELRRLNRMPQKDLAIKSDLSVSHIRSIEKSIISTGVDKIDRIAKALNVPASQLLNVDKDK